VSAQRRAELLLLSVTVIWGSTFVVTKSLIEGNSPLFYSAFRFLAAALLVLAFFPLRMMRIPRSTWLKGGVLGLLLYLGFILQTVGLQYTTASKSAFFTGMLVVLTPMVHYAVQQRLNLARKPLRIGNILGVAFAAVGLFLLTAPSGAAFTVGDALTLCCAFLFALYIVYLDFASMEPDKLQLTFVQFLFSGIVGLAVAGIFEIPRVSATTPNLLSFLYLTVAATVVAMWVQNRYQGDTTPTRAAVIFSMEPVIAAVFASVVRGEELGAAGIAGAGIIVGGVLLSEFSEEIPALRGVVRAGSGHKR